MYGPRPDCKKRLVGARYSLRKCIRPLSGDYSPGHDDDPRACGLKLRRVSGGQKPAGLDWKGGVALWRFLFSVMTLLIETGSELHDPELFAIGDALNDRVAGMHLKPHAEGSLWVVRLDVRQPVIVTFTCLDGLTDTFIVATLLALFLKGFEAPIDSTFSLPDLPARELDLYIGSIDSVPPDMRRYFPKDFNEPCVVSGVSYSKSTDKKMPTFVICRKDVAKAWKAGTGIGSDLQILFGNALIEIIFQLLRAEIDMDVLAPKIRELLRKTNFLGGKTLFSSRFLFPIVCRPTSSSV